MLKSKAVDIIKTFSAIELKDFLNFVESPYFNTSTSIIRLTVELKKFYPEFNAAILSEEYLYKKVFDNGKFSYSLMRNLMSELLQLCERFLLNNKLNADLFKKTENILTLLDEYQARNLENLYRVRMKNLESEISKEKYDPTYFRHKVYLINLLLEDEFTKASFKNSLKDVFFKKAIFEFCSIANTIYRNANSIYYISIDSGIQADESYFFKFLKCIDIERFLNETKKSKSEELTIIEIYLRLLLLILKPADIDNYRIVKKYIFDNINKFSNSERYSLLNILRNYNTYENKLKAVDLTAEARSINLKMLDSINFQKDKMDSYLGVIFLSVFTEAISNKDIKFADEFINKYSKELKKEIKKDIIGYANAYIAFLKNNPEKALEILSNVKHPNMVYFINIKTLYLKIYFELGYFEEGLSVIDTYKHFLDNRVTNKNRKEHFTGLLRFYSRLYKIKMNPEKFSEYDVKKLSDDLSSETGSLDIKWLQLKAKEMM